MSQNGSHDERGGARLEDSVFSRWANNTRKPGLRISSETAPVYMVLTCPTTFNRTLFYVPAPAPAPPTTRRKR